MIGRTQQELDDLVYAWGHGDDTLIGRALGFPETAVANYHNKAKLLDEKALEGEITQEEREELALASFRLSADNWKEELRQIKPRADFIRRVSPKLYNKITDKVK